MHEIRRTERAILVSLESGDEEEDRSSIQELKQLTNTAGAEIVSEFSQKRAKPDVTYFLGQGKAELLFADVKARDADLVIVNEDLSPTQQRNLEDIVGVRVVDRSQLILDIFAQRAHTHEGKLQVELAQLNYLLPRTADRRRHSTESARRRNRHARAGRDEARVRPAAYTETAG